MTISPRRRRRRASAAGAHRGDENTGRRNNEQCPGDPDRARPDDGQDRAQRREHRACATSTTASVQLDQPAEGHLGAARAAPSRTGRSGRPRTRGARLGTPADVAALATTTKTWRASQVRRYGRTDTVQITERVCLWYGSFRSRTVRVILVRGDKPRTRGGDDRGYGLPLVTTDLESSAEDLVARYASRWGIEQAFSDARQIIGVGEARNPTRRAVERTVPFGLIGFARAGHRARNPDRPRSLGRRRNMINQNCETRGALRVSRMSRTPVTSGDRRAPTLGHDHGRVPPVSVSDLPAGAWARPAAGPPALLQGGGAARAAP